MCITSSFSYTCCQNSWQKRPIVGPGHIFTDTTTSLDTKYALSPFFVMVISGQLKLSEI